jgi:hypothetical protein
MTIKGNISKWCFISGPTDIEYFTKQLNNNKAENLVTIPPFPTSHS